MVSIIVLQAKDRLMTPPYVKQITCSYRILPESPTIVSTKNTQKFPSGRKRRYIEQKISIALQ